MPHFVWKYRGSIASKLGSLTITASRVVTKFPNVAKRQHLIYILSTESIWKWLPFLQRLIGNQFLKLTAMRWYSNLLLFWLAVGRFRCRHCFPHHHLCFRFRCWRVWNLLLRFRDLRYSYMCKTKYSNLIMFWNYIYLLNLNIF